MQKLFLPSLLLPSLLSLLLIAANGGSLLAQTLNQAVEPTGTLTLQSALDLAFSANPRLVAASREVDAADALIQQAGTIPNPEFAALIEDQSKETRTTTLQISQPLELGGKRSARIAAAERARDVANAEVHAKRAELRSTVTAAFYNTFIAQERYHLAQASLELAKNAAIVTSKRVAAGKISPVEATKARVAAAGAQIELSQAANALNHAKRQLAATWSSKTPRFQHVDATIDTLPNIPELNDAMQRLQKAPLLTHARLEVARREALSQVERSRQIPDLTINVGAKREREENREGNRNQLIFGISIPLPVFDRNQGNLQEALHRTDKARNELAAIEIQLNTDLIQAHERLTALRNEALLLQQEVLPNAQSAYDAAVTGFELGKFNFLDLLDAQRTLFQTKSQYLNALLETHRAAAEIERIAGTSAQ